MEFQAGTPDTTIFMFGGYLVIYGILGLYVLSLIVRRKNLKRELELLQQIETQAFEEVQAETVMP